MIIVDEKIIIDDVAIKIENQQEPWVNPIANPRIPPGLLAIAKLVSQVIAAPLAEHTSALSVTTPNRNGYERLQTVASESPTEMVKWRPQKRSLKTAGVVSAAMVDVVAPGIIR